MTRKRIEALLVAQGVTQPASETIAALCQLALEALDARAAIDTPPGFREWKVYRTRRALNERVEAADRGGPGAAATAGKTSPGAEEE